MFCSSCGTANGESGQFCVKCGAALQSVPGAPASSAGVPGATPSASADVPAYIPPVQPYGVATEVSGKAIGSLVCGLLFLIFPVAIVAVVLGHLSLSDIKKSAGRLTGRGMAITGLVLGYLGLSVIPILIIAAIAIPNLLRARQAANEAYALETLRTINSSALMYYSTYGNGYPPSLEALGGNEGESPADCNHAQLIDAKVSFGDKNGYRFTYTAKPTPDGFPLALSRDAIEKGCKAPGSPAGYAVVAEPEVQGTTGQRSFYTDATGAIRYSTDGTATADSTPLQ
jgi:type IV pilus assembly protein PilA